MEHLFIINPVAGGRKNDSAATRERIRSVMAGRDEKYEIYTTKAPMDACGKIRAAAADGRELRVYACGGDGTLNECVNGAAGLPNAAVTHYPCGTGNDFIKTFGEDRALFSDLARLVDGFVRPVDLIECNGRYSVNICSVGLDARVCCDVHKYSRLPLLGGATAYVVALVLNMLKGPNMSLTIRTGSDIFTGRFALLCACNGQYYGGGFHPVPEAAPDDGVMETLIVRGVSRIQFLQLVKRYASGRYREIPARILTSLTNDSVEIESEKPFPINIDGEILTDSKAVFRMAPGRVRMIFPAGIGYFQSGTENLKDKQSKTQI